MPTPDRLERLTDLVLVLLAARRPLPLEDIAREVPGYPEDHAARRQAFERDKRLLRDEGVPVVTEQVGGRDQYGYRIDPESFYLPELDLDPEEQAALHLAVAGVHLGDPSGHDALLKLGASGLAETRPVASVVTPPALPGLFEAVRSAASVTFSYRGEERRLAPAGLWFRGGRWYVVGWDLDRQGARTFRVDRIQGQSVSSGAGSATLPAGFDPDAAVPDDHARAGEGDDDDVLVEVDHIEATRVVAEVGEAAVLERRSDGTVLLRLGVSSAEALRSWVLGLLGHAWVVGAGSFREDLIRWLRSMAESGASPDEDSHRSGQAATKTPEQPISGISAPIVSPSEEIGVDRPPLPGRDAARRLRRLLAVVGWLARVGEAPIGDVSERFGIAQDELIRELELAACCGVPPYTPDALMEIVVTESTVKAFLPAEMARPRRLTPAEGFALAAAGRTILEVPGADVDGALARALDKLEQALGSLDSLNVSLDDPIHLSEVRKATAAKQQLEIEYHSASADETTVRIVDPMEVIAVDGRWYLDAFCHRAGDVRRFRIDRIRSVRPTGTLVERAAPVDERLLSSFVPGPSALVVELAVHGEASWLADSVPSAAVELLDSGEMLVRLHVGGTAWLERLLLQLGPQARVVSPVELQGLAAAAASRVLERYADTADLG